MEKLFVQVMIYQILTTLLGTKKFIKFFFFLNKYIKKITKKKKKKAIKTRFNFYV
jgi:hypothetical protein